MFVWTRDVIKQPLCINPWNRSFSGRVNGQQKQPIGLPQCLGKFKAKIARSGIQVGLKGERDFAVWPAFSNGI